jgi:hypothetical protein
MDMTFWEWVDKSGDCWTWSGYRDRDGYGKFRSKMAHRVSWEITHGSAPKGYLVLHRCDNPPCVRPSHLFLGTAKDNIVDCISKRRLQTGRYHRDAKLDDMAVTAIRADYAAGLSTQQQLANRHGISQARISKIIRGVTWRHGSNPGVGEATWRSMSS